MFTYHTIYVHPADSNEVAMHEANVLPRIIAQDRA